MNGSVILGTVIILAAAFLQAPYLIAWLAVGIGLIAYGAFGPSPTPVTRPKMDNDRFV
jgi:hypothetical protein